MGLIKFSAIAISLPIAAFALFWSTFVRTVFWVLPRAGLTLLLALFSPINRHKAAVMMIIAVATFWGLKVVTNEGVVQHPLTNYLVRFSDLSDHMGRIFWDHKEQVPVEYVSNRTYGALTQKERFNLKLAVNKPEYFALRDGLSASGYYSFSNTAIQGVPERPYERLTWYAMKGLKFAEDDYWKLNGVPYVVTKVNSTERMSQMFPLEPTKKEPFSLMTHEPLAFITGGANDWPFLQFAVLVFAVYSVLTIVASMFFTRLFTGVLDAGE